MISLVGDWSFSFRYVRYVYLCTFRYIYVHSNYILMEDTPRLHFTWLLRRLACKNLVWRGTIQNMMPRHSDLNSQDIQNMMFRHSDLNTQDIQNMMFRHSDLNKKHIKYKNIRKYQLYTNSSKNYWWLLFYFNDLFGIKLIFYNLSWMFFLNFYERYVLQHESFLTIFSW